MNCASEVNIRYCTKLTHNFILIDTSLAGTNQNCLNHIIRVTVSLKTCQDKSDEDFNLF